jgi:hypothetical protein
MFAVVDHSTLAYMPEADKKFTLYMQTMNMDTSRLEKQSSSFEIKSYPMQPCSFKFIPDSVKDYLVADISKYWCLPDGFNHYINGSYGANGQFLRLQVDPCKNSSIYNLGKCYSDEYLYKTLPVFNLHFIVQDSSLNGYNFTEPGSTTYQYGFTKSNVNTFS